MNRFTSSAIALLLCIISVISFTACSSTPAGPAAEPTSTDALVTDEPDIVDPTATDVSGESEATIQPSENSSTPSPEPVGSPTSAPIASYEKWIATEFTFNSKDSYKSVKDILSVCVMDAIFTSPTGKKLTVPAFWDGDNIWRVRFAPNEIGNWTYTTTCAADSSLNGKTGKFACVAYKGKLDIYKHGFVKTKANTPCFLYDDGTPFFYLGDTHWAMITEEFDSAGPNAGDLKTDSHFKYIVDKRVEQKFTVYQSAPIDVTFNFSNGFSNADLSGLRVYDKYIEYIAEKGLVHANGMLFWTNRMYYKAPAIYKNGTYDYEYLEKISRYWVARYSAYPMMWTMAQEVDKDFYHSRGDQNYFDTETNPWKRVAAFTYKYDPYKHPLTAHMESASVTRGTTVTTSSFRNIEGHSWFAIQTGFQRQPNFTLVKDFWKDSQGKVLVMYEGYYENLWTANYGARAQGWYAYLNGIFGYGYGAQSLWYYKSTYGTEGSSNDGFDTITVNDKMVQWPEAIEFATGYQLTYMRDFFESFDWWKLRPEFDNNKKFKFSSDALWACAADGTDTYVAYLYKKNNVSGQIINMDNAAKYTVKWFNPRTNEYTEIGKNISPVNGVYTMPSKPTALDWVIIATKNK